MNSNKSIKKQINKDSKQAWRIAIQRCDFAAENNQSLLLPRIGHPKKTFFYINKDVFLFIVFRHYKLLKDRLTLFESKSLQINSKENEYKLI